MRRSRRKRPARGRQGGSRASEREQRKRKTHREGGFATGRASRIPSVAHDPSKTGVRRPSARSVVRSAGAFPPLPIDPRAKNEETSFFARSPPRARFPAVSERKPARGAILDGSAGRSRMPWKAAGTRFPPLPRRVHNDMAKAKKAGGKGGSLVVNSKVKDMIRS